VVKVDQKYLLKLLGTVFGIHGISEPVLERPSLEQNAIRRTTKANHKVKWHVI
jgi:hypothetical protein